MGEIDRSPTAGSAVPESARGATAAGVERSGRPHWRRLLAGSSPREVLARLVNGDPLGLRAVVARRLRAQCYLLDADRVFLRALARCARFSTRYRGQPPLADWLEERIDEAVGDLLTEDLEAARDDAARSPTAGTAYEDLARPLGLDPAAMRRACVAFDHADFACRRAFFELVIAGRSLDELARAGDTGATELARRARRALDRCLAASAPAREPPAEERP